MSVNQATRITSQAPMSSHLAVMSASVVEWGHIPDAHAQPEMLCVMLAEKRDTFAPNADRNLWWTSQLQLVLSMTCPISTQWTLTFQVCSKWA